jgi:hypothetical protein
VPPDGTSTASYESGDFGRSPFFGQLSGKHCLPVLVYLWYQAQSTIGAEK